MRRQLAKSKKKKAGKGKEAVVARALWKPGHLDSPETKALLAQLLGAPPASSPPSGGPVLSADAVLNSNSHLPPLPKGTGKDMLECLLAGYILGSMSKDTRG